MITKSRDENTQAYLDGRRPDETRVKASNYQRFEITLTQNSLLTKESVEKYKEEHKDAYQRNLASSKPRRGQSIQVSTMAGDEDPDEEEVSSPIIKSWSLADVTQKSMYLDIIFNDPISVSSQEMPDVLLLALDLSLLETVDGEKLSSNVLKITKIPKQMLSESEVETVNTSGSTGSEVVKDSFALNFVTQLFLSGSMEELWGMLENLQVIQNLRLTSVRTPGNVNAFTAFFEMFASVEIFDSEDLFRENLYMPEKEPESLNLVNAGYDTTLFVFTARNSIFNGLLLLLLELMNLILWLVNRGLKSDKLNRIIAAVNRFVFYGAINRFFIESYISITICALLNIADMEWIEGISSVTASNILAVFFLSVCLLWPVLFCVYAYRNRADWSEEHFIHRFGTFLQGISTSPRKSRVIAIIVALAFFARRFILVVTIIYLQHVLWA